MAKMATREAYGKTLAELIVKNENVIVLDADLSKSTKTNDAKVACPSRHINMGIAEANMMATAAGLATSGNIVYASTFAMFAAGRAFEQIRNSIGYPHLNVKVCATHAGISVGEDGASHQSFEDLALMRTIPGMVVICPSDDIETTQVINTISEYKGPCYVRLGRSAVETINTDPNYKFEIGKGYQLRKGSKIAIIANGLLVSESIKAYDILKQEGIEVSVYNFPTIKPLDTKLLLEISNNYDTIITCEEHSVIGGFGSAISEYLSEANPIKIVKVGQLDCFGESGKPDQLLKKYNMDSEYIISKVKENM